MVSSANLPQTRPLYLSNQNFPPKCQRRNVKRQKTFVTSPPVGCALSKERLSLVQKAIVRFPGPRWIHTSHGAAPLPTLRLFSRNRNSWRPRSPRCAVLSDGVTFEGGASERAVALPSRPSGLVLPSQRLAEEADAG